MELTKKEKKELKLTKTEEDFLNTLTDPFLGDDLKVLTDKGKLCGLRPDDVAYIVEWVVNQGIHWLSCEEAGLSEMDGAKVFRNPVVRKVINKAAELGICQATSALKDELEDYYSQRLRNPFMPEVIRDNAADKLAKLKGYYPKENASGGGSALVQINMVNPYAEVEVKDEPECETV